jgi:carbon-monoxide dehydrogenase small subunit
MSVVEVVNDGIDPDADESVIREAIAGNLCRCTGYQGIVNAVRMAAREMSEARKKAGSAAIAEEVKI